MMKIRNKSEMGFWRTIHKLVDFVWNDPAVMFPSFEESCSSALNSLS